MSHTIHLAFLSLLVTGLTSCSSKDGSEQSKSTSGICQPEEAECDGDWLVVCSPEGDEIEELLCPTGSSCSGGQCTGKCKPGTSVCDGGIVRSCNDDGTGFLMHECAPGVCIDGECKTCYSGTKT